MGLTKQREMTGEKDVFDLVAQLEAVERVGSVGVEHLGQVAQGKREVHGQLAVAVHTVLHGLVQDGVQDQGCQELTRGLPTAQLQTDTTTDTQTQTPLTSLHRLCVIHGHVYFSHS